MESEHEARLRASVGGPALWTLRKRTAMKTARDFIAVGTAMSASSDLDKETSDAIQAVSLLLRMAGELAIAAGRMLSEGEHYAGAALVRQLVEIEYLTWTFKEGHRSAGIWLRSNHQERREMFSPAQLRKTSKGRFLAKDYQHHCEQGGHPVPIGSFLLGHTSPGGAQLLLVDMICHCWRTWDQVALWSRTIPNAAASVIKYGSEVSARLNGWGRRDPMYAWMIERLPDEKY